MEYVKIYANICARVLSYKEDMRTCKNLFKTATVHSKDNDINLYTLEL